MNISSAFAGFRSYQSLLDGLSLLASQRDDFDIHRIGHAESSSQDIYAFAFGRGNATSPVMLQTGGSHAREWATPEAVSWIAEQLTTHADDGGLETYLRDQARILLVPVLNPDGFMATQADPTHVRVNEDPDGDPATPRDGRMRRKNLRDSDGKLDSPADTLNGVDINRNIGQFWGTSSRSSASPQSIVYQGDSRESESETLALIQAGDLFGSEHLRLFIDTHSFGRVFFYNNTPNNQRLFNITRDLVDLIRVVPSQNYARQAESSGIGIGASDEYFGYQLQVPSYTLELEPGNNQAAEYGGNPNVSHSGFILPEAEVPRVRSEVYAMSLLAYYQQMGAAIAQSLSINAADSGLLVYQAQWRNQDAATRTLQISSDATLSAGVRYRLRLQFNKPMRWRNAQGGIAAYPGLQLPADPILHLLDGNQEKEIGDATGHWIDTKWQADTYELNFTPTSNLAPELQLRIDVRDLAGRALDSRPGTALNWENGAWIGFEDEDGVAGDRGGRDNSFKFKLNTPAATPSGGGSGSLSAWSLAWGLAWILLCLLRTSRTNSTKPYRADMSQQRKNA